MMPSKYGRFFSILRVEARVGVGYFRMVNGNTIQ